jgi:raffinose/stachyose/melibiose transport system permease protein
MITKSVAKKSIFYVAITIFSIVWLIPIFFVIMTALKTTQDFFGKPIFSLPEVLHWRNFYDAWVKGNLSLYMKNGLIIAGLKVPLGILISSLAAFYITRVCSKKTGTRIFLFFLVGMMIPMQVTLIPLNIALSRLKLINTYFGLFIVYLGFGIPFGILVLRGFMRTIPKELDEAALIDGCSRFRLYWNVILPITKPALATLMIIDFLATWNEFMLASIFITDNSMRTVPAGLLNFIGQYGTQYGLLNAGVLISVVPVLVVYILFQRFFVQGLAGSVKG